jgi:ligand-binding sensor domain-containing protein
VLRDYRIGFSTGGACLIGCSTGVYRLSATGWQALDLPLQWQGAKPTALMATAKGDIWLGTAGEGVFIYRNGSWLRSSASNGLTDNYVRSLREDQKGAVWIGTQYGGVTRYVPHNGM